MSDPYQSLERIRERIEHTPEDIFGDDANAEARFDRLLMGTDATDPDAPDAESWPGLEAEARGIIETLTGDQPLDFEADRVDEIRPGYDAALTLVFPVQDVSKVEYKSSLRAEYRELDTARWTFTKHHLVLESFRARRGGTRGGIRRNTLADTANRATWNDLAAKVRVTYDRGFDPVPLDIQSVQIALINRQLRLMRAEQSFSAASPEEWQGVSPEFDRVVTEDIRDRLADFTTIGGGTMSV